MAFLSVWRWRLVSTTTHGLAREGAGDALEAFFDTLPSSRSGLLRWALTHPRDVVWVRRTLEALPTVHAAPSGTADGRALAAGLSRRSAIGRVLTSGATPVITIPSEQGAFAAGSARRTLRKKRNGALRAGIAWSSVTDPDERRRLLDVAGEAERVHPDDRYRNALPDIEHLLGAARWWLATNADGRPLLLAVAAVDGEWAMLQYFRTMRQDADATLARFLMTEVIVDDLGADGVLHLATDMSPVRMSPGIRAFQHQVGFELQRVVVAAERRGRSARQRVGSTDRRKPATTGTESGS